MPEDMKVREEISAHADEIVKALVGMEQTPDVAAMRLCWHIHDRLVHRGVDADMEMKAMGLVERLFYGPHVTVAELVRAAMSMRPVFDGDGNQLPDVAVGTDETDSHAKAVFDAYFNSPR